MDEVIVGIIASVVSLLAGGGGVFAYLTNKQKNKQDSNTQAVIEWKALYDEMKNRLDAQEKENEELRNEIHELKNSVNNLTIELENYKRYDTFINELEKYTEHLLHTIKGLINEDAYRNICAKKPIRTMSEQAGEK